MFSPANRASHSYHRGHVANDLAIQSEPCRHGNQNNGRRKGKYRHENGRRLIPVCGCLDFVYIHKRRHEDSLRHPRMFKDLALFNHTTTCITEKKAMVVKKIQSLFWLLASEFRNIS